MGRIETVENVAALQWCLIQPQEVKSKLSERVNIKVLVITRIMKKYFYVPMIKRHINFFLDRTKARN